MTSINTRINKLNKRIDKLIRMREALTVSDRTCVVREPIVKSKSIDFATVESIKSVKKERYTIKEHDDPPF